MTEPYAEPEGVLFRVFSETDAVTDADVLAAWAADDMVVGQEAQRRLHEVLLVGTTDAGAVVSVTTAYLRTNAQLRMDVWYLRVFTASEHRRTLLGTAALDRTCRHLEERFVTGRDRRGAGALVVVQEPNVRRTRSEARWERTGFVYIGETELGYPYRVRFFPGVLAPPPPRPS